VWTRKDRLGNWRRIGTRLPAITKVPVRWPIGLFERSILLAIPSCLTDRDEQDIVRAFRKGLRQASMKSRKRLNVAMIGQGFMGRAHSNAFHQVGHFCESSYELNLKVICGRNQPQLKAMAARWGWEEVASDWAAIVERKDVDVIDICTPNYLACTDCDFRRSSGQNCAV